MSEIFDDLERGRRVERSSAWIQTWSGVRFDLLDPRPEDVHVEDIVHALANVNRFTGHARWAYSVAEHSVNVAELVSPAHRKIALLHDATEAYVNDLAAPLKRLPALAGYRDIERGVWQAIAARFDLPAAVPPEVKRADLVMLDIERRLLLGSPPAPWELPVEVGEVLTAARLLAFGPQKPGQLALGKDPLADADPWPSLRRSLGALDWQDAKKWLGDALAKEGVV